MIKSERYNELVVITNNTALIWKEARGIAPDTAADKLDYAMLEWLSELTRTLKIWIDKGLSMTTGELILARANLGAVVESWLKLFYTVYYDDYKGSSPFKNNKGRITEPEKIKFEDLKNSSTGKLWDDNTSFYYKWVDSVQSKRNAIHSFQYKEIGTPQEFLDDIDHLYDFVDNVRSHFPPLEDYIEVYPVGFERIPVSSGRGDWSFLIDKS